LEDGHGRHVFPIGFEGFVRNRVIGVCDRFITGCMGVLGGIPKYSCTGFGHGCNDNDGKEKVIDTNLSRNSR